MSVIHFDYKRVRKYSQTFHPPEEIRVQREIASLRRKTNPFRNGLQLVSRNAQLRMLEDFSSQLGYPHPRMLGGGTDFYEELEGFNVQMMSFIYFYRKLRKELGISDSVVGFMLDRLGVPRINTLSVEEQIGIVRYMKKISWKATSESFRVWAIERLAEEAEVPHPRALVFEEFMEINIPEIDSVLYGLYGMYRDECPKNQTMPDFMLNKLNFQAFDELSWEDQLLCLRAKKIRWRIIPYSTQLKLLALLLEKLPMQNGVRCPHLRGLIWTSFDIHIPEIDNSLSGLYAYWKKRRPKSYKGRVIDYMLDQLRVKKFEELDREIQYGCKLYNRVFPWERMPDESVLHLFDRTAELAEMRHTRALMRRVVASTPLPELGGRTLNALVHRFRPGNLGGEFEGTSLERALDHYGAPESTLAAQMEKFNRYFVRRGEVPDHVISYYLERLRRAVAAGNTEAADHLAYFYRLYKEETAKEITERSIRCIEQLKHPSIDMDFYDIEKATDIPAMTLWRIYNKKEKSTQDILAKLLKILS